MAKKKYDTSVVLRDQSGGVPERSYGGDIEVLKKPSGIILLQKYRLWIMRQYEEYTRAGTDLIEALDEHQKAKARFATIDIEIDEERMRREAKRKQARVELQLTDIDGETAIMEAKARRDKALRALKGEDKKDESRHKIDRKRREQKEELETMKIKLESHFGKQKVADNFRGDREREILGDSSLSSEEKEEKIEELDDFVRTVISGD